MKSIEKRGVSYRRCCRASIRLTISLPTQSRGDHLLSSDTVLVAGDFQGRYFTERIAEIIRPMRQIRLATAPWIMRIRGAG